MSIVTAFKILKRKTQRQGDTRFRFVFVKFLRLAALASISSASNILCSVTLDSLGKSPALIFQLLVVGELHAIPGDDGKRVRV